MRDRNLDIYRGGIMIYITCFVHLIWWEGVKVGIFEGGWITGIFFAMATVFYLAGASFSLSTEKPFLSYLKGRIKRVAIPYWKYAFICLPAVIYHYWKHAGMIPLNDFISYVFFTPRVEYRLFDHIWFILPYLIISLCLPLLSRIIRRYNVPFVFFSIVLVVLLWFKGYYTELLQTVFVYLFFTIWGLYYKKRLGWQIIVCVIASVGYLIYAFGVEKVPFDLQANKFPPTLLFASYGLAILGIGGIYIKRGLVFFYNRYAVVRHYIDLYSTNGYEIYLIHPFTIILLGVFKRVLGLNRIIADHLYLQVLYVIAGFLFLLCVNVYVFRLYNYVWSLINKGFKVVFPFKLFS